MSPEYLHHSKLLVGNTHNAHVSFFRQAAFYSFYMHVCIFLAAAMAHINTELKHVEQVQAEKRSNDKLKYDTFIPFKNSPLGLQKLFKQIKPTELNQLLSFLCSALVL